MAEIAAAGCSSTNASDQQDDAFQQTSTSILLTTPNENRHDTVSAVLSSEPPGKQSHAAVLGLAFEMPRPGGGTTYSQVHDPAA